MALGGGRAGVGTLFLELLEAEFVVFLHFACLILHLQNHEGKLLDLAGELAYLLLKLADTRIGRLDTVHKAALHGRLHCG